MSRMGRKGGVAAVADGRSVGRGGKQGRASSKLPGGDGFGVAAQRARRPDESLFQRRVRVKCDDFHGRVSEFNGTITGWNARLKEYK